MKFSALAEEAVREDSARRPGWFARAPMRSEAFNRAAKAAGEIGEAVIPGHCRAYRLDRRAQAGPGAGGAFAVDEAGINRRNAFVEPGQPGTRTWAAQR